MEEITEETDYVNAPEGPADKKATRPEDTKKGSAPEGTVDTKASPPGLSFVLPIAVCWIILLAIMGLRIYFDTLIHESDPNQLEEVSTLRANNTKLSLENANLKRDNKNLEDQLGNLTQAYTVSESNVKNLSAGVQVLSKLNQELETKTKNLNQKIQDMRRNWNELNISRAQWSINSYCLAYDDKKCRPCQKSWNLTEPSCYAYNDPQPADRKTWEEAQEDCSGKNSYLAVTHTPAEKEAINENRLGVYGFWIGLRVEDEKWKWVDGSDLTESSWIDPHDPVDGRCAVFFKGKWFSVSCGEKRIWICQKKALSV